MFYYSTSTRKVCKNCLCPREEHDIGEEREASGRISVGKILFSPDVDTMTRRTSEGRPYSPKYVSLSLSLSLSHSLSCPLNRVRMSCSSTGESPSILRKLQNYLWTPKGCSVEEVSKNSAFCIHMNTYKMIQHNTTTQDHHFQRTINCLGWDSNPQILYHLGYKESSAGWANHSFKASQPEK